MKVYVCIGSSCHLKGSHTIIELMKKYLEEAGLANKVELKAAFCLGKCTDGVVVRIDEEIICGVSANNFEEIFNGLIKDKLIKQE